MKRVRFFSTGVFDLPLSLPKFALTVTDLDLGELVLLETQHADDKLIAAAAHFETFDAFVAK